MRTLEVGIDLILYDYELQNIMSEAKDEGCEIIMTEKVYHKIKQYNNKINFLKVSLEIDKKEKFFKKVIKLYDQNN